SCALGEGRGEGHPFFLFFAGSLASGLTPAFFVASAIRFHAHIAGLGTSPSAAFDLSLPESTSCAFSVPLRIASWYCSDFCVSCTMFTLALSQCSTTSSSCSFFSS